MSDHTIRQHRKKPASRSDTPEARRFVQVKTVIMLSDAWQDCDFSTRCAYFELSARLQWASGQSDPTNNGRLWLSRSEWERAGFAPATVTRATKQLIQTGLLYRTRSGGIGRGCSEYALTCYPLTKDTSDIFCQGFKKDAWTRYTPASKKKTRESKMNRDRFKNDELPHENGEKQIKFEQAPGIISEHQEAESTNLRGIIPFIRPPQREPINIVHYPRIAGGRLQPLQLCA